LQFVQRRSSCKVEAEESVPAGEIRTIRKNPNALHQNNRKDGLSTSQSARLHPTQAGAGKDVNSFKRLSLEKRVLEHPISQSHLRNCSSSLSHPITQRLLQP
jgi:hypothetical protein